MSDLATIQTHFAQQLAALQRFARFHFRGYPPEARQEMIANVVALAWKFFHSLYRKGRADEPGILNSCLRYAIKQVHCGRKVEGKNRSKDILDYRRSRKVRIDGCDLDGFVGRSTPVVDAVSFRVDVPDFLATLDDRQQRMAVDLATGMTTGEAAEKYGLSAGRISQFRKEFKQLFDEFFAE